MVNSNSQVKAPSSVDDMVAGVSPRVDSFLKDKYRLLDSMYALFNPLHDVTAEVRERVVCEYVGLASAHPEHLDDLFEYVGEGKFGTEIHRDIIPSHPELAHAYATRFVVHSLMEAAATELVRQDPSRAVALLGERYAANFEAEYLRRAIVADEAGLAELTRDENIHTATLAFMKFVRSYEMTAARRGMKTSDTAAEYRNNVAQLRDHLQAHPAEHKLGAYKMFERYEQACNNALLRRGQNVICSTYWIFSKWVW